MSLSRLPSRMTRARSVLVIIATLALLAPTQLAAAPAKPKPKKADLKVAAGSAVGSAGRVTGSITVKNTGTKKAKATVTSVLLDGLRVGGVATGQVKPDKKAVVPFSVAAATGVHDVKVCADEADKVTEKKEGNNCRALGKVTVTSPTAPSDPIEYTDDTVFGVPASGDSPGYSLLVPTTYDDTHQTPIRLVVFLHGCGDTAANQAMTAKFATPNTRPYIFLSLGGRDGDCWLNSDKPKVAAAIADVKTHFNIAPKQTVLGGYSSGTDLVGPMAFADANSYAGLLVLLSRPFTSTVNRPAAIANAAWKLNVVWRAHISDGTYPIATVRDDRDALLAASFPLTYSEIAGTHEYTYDDLTYVLSQIGVGWTAP